MKKEIISTVARLHDAMRDFESDVNKMNDIMDYRNAQERIRIIRTILDQINKKIEARITDWRTQ